MWPAPTTSGHINHASLKKQHARTFRTINTPPKQDGKAAEAKPELENDKKLQRIRPFVLYAFRHTFVTRLGESGCGRLDVGEDRRA